ncbi:anaphase-promoting complex subunit 10 isoform X2 [Anopheles funestus]|uniref:anaphase-promoting complex subunit 10 isoform X2 n=1 Tax=Anopheles funestus TaxID=62324 RepID=UPI0020C6B3B2|nr:anaphase-promoting complex subunit 10 isoform X2 [Anopheles funestus]
MSVKMKVNVCPITEERSGTVREVGGQAVWSLSSCKPGFGVDQLRDNSMETYWQSDGQLPHLVNIQFHRKTTVSQIYIYSDYKLDESYTPSRISIRCGMHFNDLQEVEVVDLCEPSGWIAVISNHQNGRDTHMRQIRIHSPTEGSQYPLEHHGKFSTLEFSQFRTIR